MTQLATLPQMAQTEMRTTEPLDAAAFARLRRRMALDCCKWDSQVGDHCGLAPFALLLDAATWQKLARWTEALAVETIEAEQEIARRPDLWRTLAIPRRLARLLKNARLAPTPAAPRIMRFDFHPTPRGWRISEVNSDVPGGYTESSSLPAMMAQALQCGATPAGDPAGAWANAMARATRSGHILLTCAPGLMDDFQIQAYLAQRLTTAGCKASIASLRQISWHDGHASLIDATREQPIDAIFRFYQAEWLAMLPRRFGWPNLFSGGKTPVTNPPACVFTESKGLPLIWDALRTKMETWRELLPETRPLRDVPWHDPACVLKEKFSNNGESVGIGLETPATEWKKIRRHAFWFPNAWVAQERFETTTIDTPAGPLRPCLGIYAIDGKAAGIYGRLSRGQIVDYRAIDAAVLVEGETHDP